MLTDSPENVVSMVARSQAQQTAPLVTVERYWTSLLKDNRLPMRSDVDPRRIENALEYAFVAERVTDSLAKLRLAGAHLNDLMGMSMAGMPLGSLFTTKARPFLADATRKMFGGPCVIRLELSTPASVWAEPMTGEMVLLPMLSDLEDTSRVLGCLVTQGRIGRSPRRFEIKKIRVKPILLKDAADVFETPPSTQPSSPVVEVRPVTITRPAVRHLELVVDNA